MIYTYHSESSYLLLLLLLLKSLQSCPTLCDPIDGSPLGSSVPGILQARILDWVAISFSKFPPSRSNWTEKWRHLRRTDQEACLGPSFWFGFVSALQLTRISLVAQTVKNLPAMQETQVQSLGWEDPLGNEMATRFSIHAWRIRWTEEPGRLQSMGSQSRTPLSD